MSPIPKIKPFKEPEGYFDSLPDQIMAKVQPKRQIAWGRWAAAAVIIISVGIYRFYPSNSEDELLVMDEQVNLMIDANYWTAEDILGMSDNPDELLDGIIEEELPIVDELWIQEDPYLIEL